MFGLRKLSEPRVLLPPTRITQKSVTTLGAGQDDIIVASLHDDIYPANEVDPTQWPKWRRVITNMRDGTALIYTLHEAA